MEVTVFITVMLPAMINGIPDIMEVAIDHQQTTPDESYSGNCKWVMRCINMTNCNYKNLIPALLCDEMRLKNLSEIGEIPISAQILNLLRNELSDKVELERVLKPLTNLKVLYISENNFTELKPLKDSKQLIEFEANSNNLNDISESMFTYNENIKCVSFKNNNITSISYNSFSSNNNIEQLYLSHNHIKDIGFIPLGTNLRILDLRYNKIKDLPRKMFLNCPNLAELYLQGNVISHIEHFTFLQCHKMRITNLAINQIAEFPSWIFGANLKNFDMLDFTENPFVLPNNSSWDGLLDFTNNDKITFSAICERLFI